MEVFAPREVARAATFFLESMTPCKENSTLKTGLIKAVCNENTMEVKNLLSNLIRYREFFLNSIREAQEEFTCFNKQQMEKVKQESIKKLTENSTKYMKEAQEILQYF
uniref:Uncharacterized protein n=1 Tax=Strombidium inclinatum TaxID=197538 RepID=A0A7S3IPG8_9SPIT|mmetsp:Transcript_32144/g.49158  ORF Transcript_32144/g.49158 Transcript_32144/m.49158 type:complete len:108 (+) Transcript_32144:659-982(+)